VAAEAATPPRAGEKERREAFEDREA